MAGSHALVWTLAGRFVQSVITLWLVTVLFFLITELAPGDFAIASATQTTSLEMIEATRHRLGLFASAPERYLKWILGLMRGDLGMSWWASQPVSHLIADRLWHSVWLFSWATAVTVPISLGLAITAAAHRDGIFDRASSWIALTAMSIPDFVIAYALIIFLALHLNLFPTFTMFALDMPFAERLHASALPILSLAAVTITPMFRLSRAALINVLGTDYIEMATVKGLSRWRILYRHALPNAVGPIANAIALALANLFFGLVVVEVIFSYPGLGRLLVTAASQRDIPLVLACALISAVVIVSVNFLADTIVLLTNPRMRYPMSSAEKHRFVGLWRGRHITIVLFYGAFVGTLALAMITGAVIYWCANEKYMDNIITVPTPSGDQRDLMNIAALHGDSPYLTNPIHYNYFKPFGVFQQTKHTLQGKLYVPEFKARRRRAGQTEVAVDIGFPSFEFNFITQGDVLLPIEHDKLLQMSSKNWSIIVSPGRVWHEPLDGDWSRGSFPFTLVSLTGLGPHYGVATFAFNNKSVSQLRIQIAQETANWAQFDLWGQTAMTFIPGLVAGAQVARNAYARIVETQLDVRPWSELAAKHWRSLESFDGKGNRHNITVSGLMIDNVFYLRPCRTRAGPHPYCREMRHGVYSITKTLGATISMLWLAQKYGPDVFDEKITDYVSIPASHDGWKSVTFGNALNMVTGIGNVAPEIVDYYVEADSSVIGNKVWRAQSIDEKLAAMAMFKKYPWSPGEVFRYRTSDTTALSAAMEAYLRLNMGQQSDLWDSVTRDVLQPLGIDRLPVRRSVETDGRKGTPLFGAGMFVTVEDALKLARLFQDHGRYKGKQLLHRTLTARAVSNGFFRGYPNGWRTKGGVGHYEMGFWLTPHKRMFECKVRIPVMAGFGGNYVIVMPNRTIGLRFADGHDDDQYTWDSSGIRKISNQIRSFCK